MSPNWLRKFIGQRNIGAADDPKEIEMEIKEEEEEFHDEKKHDEYGTK